MNPPRRPEHWENILDKPVELPNGRERKKTFAELAVALIFHLLGTGVIFVAFFTIGWMVSFALHWLHTIHPLPEEIFRIITRFEVWLVYVDALVCAAFFIAGAGRFLRELMEVR